MNVERDVIEAAVAAASRARFEAVRAGLGGVGVPTRTYDELSDRTRRIRADQIRPTVEAAYPVIAAAVRAQVAEETAAAIEATTILPVQYDVDRVANIATRIDAEIARRAAAAPEVAPTERFECSAQLTGYVPPVRSALTWTADRMSADMTEPADDVDRLRSIWRESPQTRGFIEDRYPGLAHAIERAVMKTDHAASPEHPEHVPVHMHPEQVARLRAAEIQGREVASLPLDELPDWTELAEAVGAELRDHEMGCSGEYETVMHWPDGRTAGYRDRLAIISADAELPTVAEQEAWHAEQERAADAAPGITVDRVRTAARSMLGWCDDPTADPTILGSILAPLVRSVAAEPVDEVACPVCGAMIRARMSDQLDGPAHEQIDRSRAEDGLPPLYADAQPAAPVAAPTEPATCEHGETRPHGNPTITCPGPPIRFAAPTDPADWQAIAAEAVEALRLTREYVGEKTLPAWPGWSWFDATNRYRAAAGLPQLPAEPAAGQFTAGEVVCVRCGRRGTHGFVISSGNGDGTRDTYACASSTACDRRGTDLPEIEPPNGDLLEALERSRVQARGDGLPPDTGEAQR